MAQSTSSNDTATQAESHLHTEKESKPFPSIDTSASASMNQADAPASPGFTGSNPIFSRHNTIDLDDYFTGPRDISKHSKWPLFMRMHGSILPRMILPVLFMAAWSTAITVISKKVHWLGVDSVLLTITGFVVGLGLSFRSSTAYERYAEGRRYWAQLVSSSGILGRIFWVHATEKGEQQDVRELMVRKVNSMNLVVAFANALKHQLRFEPYTSHADMQHLVGHLSTLANDATASSSTSQEPGPKKNMFKATGEYLGLPFAMSNPRKAIKKSPQPLGNLPLEILSHIAVSIDTLINNGQLDIALVQSTAYGSLNMMHDVLTGCDKVLTTPLPIAYSIAISQITWIYILLLPFQLLPFLDWICIPASIAATYIIVGLLMIGQEIENPFGSDVNDLPLDSYCDQIAHDMDIIASFDKRDYDAFLMRGLPLYPVSSASAATWAQRDEDKLRETIASKHKTAFHMQRWQTKMHEQKSPEHMV